MRVRDSRFGMTQTRNNYSGGVGEKSGRWMHRYWMDLHDCLLPRHTSEKVSVYGALCHLVVFYVVCHLY